MKVCPRCKLKVLNTNDGVESGLYKSMHLICVPCFDAEDKQIEKEGTNDLPLVLKDYGPANHY